MYSLRKRLQLCTPTVRHFFVGPPCKCIKKLFFLFKGSRKTSAFFDLFDYPKIIFPFDILSTNTENYSWVNNFQLSWFNPKIPLWKVSLKNFWLNLCRERTNTSMKCIPELERESKTFRLRDLIGKRTNWALHLVISNRILNLNFPLLGKCSLKSCISVFPDG